MHQDKLDSRGRCTLNLHRVAHLIQTAFECIDCWLCVYLCFHVWWAESAQPWWDSLGRAYGFMPRLLGIQIKVMLWSLEAESQVYSVLMLFKSNRIILLFWRNAFCEDPPGSFKAAWFGGRKYLQFFICGLIKLQKYRRFMFCFCWHLKVYVIFDKADSL